MTEQSTTKLRLATAEGVVEVSVRGAVFDCDGLLIDSESLWLQMIDTWLAEHDIQEFSAEHLLGLSVHDAAARLSHVISAPRLSGGHGTAPEVAERAPTLAAELTHRYSDLLSSGVDPMPGAVTLFTSLAARVPVAVASNGLRHDVIAMLADAALLSEAHTVCTVEDVSAGKPAPDLYLQACERLGVAPENTVALEDSPAGAQAASAAGLLVIGVNSDPSVELQCRWRLGSLDSIAVDS
jgi:HAD superfamily hydrolase (TIGR01509 family)